MKVQHQHFFTQVSIFFCDTLRDLIFLLRMNVGRLIIFSAQTHSATVIIDWITKNIEFHICTAFEKSDVGSWLYFVMFVTRKCNHHMLHICTWTSSLSTELLHKSFPNTFNF